MMTCEVTVVLAETPSASLFLLLLDVGQFCVESMARVNPQEVKASVAFHRAAATHRL